MTAPDAGTCTRREHLHEPYDTITRLQAEVEKWRASFQDVSGRLVAAEAQVDIWKGNYESADDQISLSDSRAEKAEAQVQAVRALADDARQNGTRLSALMVLDELGSAS
jgi:multidrug resistance efflux pump